jgi:hypothetical protein
VGNVGARPDRRLIVGGTIYALRRHSDISMEIFVHAPDVDPGLARRLPQLRRSAPMRRLRTIAPQTWLYAAALLTALRLLRRAKARSTPRTADRCGEHQAPEAQPGLQILLTAYSVERQDNASEVHTIATFVGFILAYLVGAIAVLSSTSLRPVLNPGVGFSLTEYSGHPIRLDLAVRGGRESS